MKKFLLAIATGVLFSAAVTAQAASQPSVGVVNMRSILTGAPQVKQINAELKKQFKPQQDKIVQKAQVLQADINNLKKNQSVLSKTKLANLKDKISSEEAVLRNEQTAYQMDVQKQQNKLMSSFITKLKSAVKAVANQKHLEMVMPANVLIYADNNLDITSDVLKQLK